MRARSYTFYYNLGVFLLSQSILRLIFLTAKKDKKQKIKKRKEKKERVKKLFWRYTYL